MRVNPFWMPVLVIAILLGTVGAAQVTGVWSTSGRTAVNLSTLTPDDLKGWMTLQQVMEGLGIEQSELYAHGNIPADVSPATALKDLEGLVPGFELTALRDALKARSPTDPSNEPPADNDPTPIATISETADSPSVPVITATPLPAAHASPTPLPVGEILPANQIKGRMSLREVSDQCDVPFDTLLAALALPPETNGATLLKDLVSAEKISDVTSVQRAVAELQK